MQESVKGQSQVLEGFKGEAQGHLDSMKAGKYLYDSELVVKPQEKIFIRQFLESLYKQEVKLVLIFRASRDGWSPLDFHRLCDD